MFGGNVLHGVSLVENHEVIPEEDSSLDVFVKGAQEAQAKRVGKIGIGVDEARSAALWWTYSSAKAKRELGFAPRPHEETLEATLTMTREQLGGRIGTSPGPAGALLEAVGRAGRVAGRFLPR